ncbi:MAG TPA: FG-GAP-like repeat-containing protein [Anaerolineae bacterium]|nr:FG-GAP-like repeat-containing protein [Anaerolineae bacterium]
MALDPLWSARNSRIITPTAWRQIGLTILPGRMPLGFLLGMGLNAGIARSLFVYAAVVALSVGWLFRALRLVEPPAGRRLSLIAISFACLLAACSFYPSGPPAPRSNAVSLSDLDGDGDVDAVVGNGPGNIDYSGEPNTIWLNDGSGRFSDTGQRLIGSHGTNWDVTHAVALGDLDGDGDTDALFGNAVPSPNTVWLNDGAGHFQLHGEYAMKPPDEFGYILSQALALGDLDGDGDLDVYVGNCCRSEYGGTGPGGPFEGYANADNMVWFNDGAGRFTDSGQRLGNRATGAIALGDLDGDGDLDAFEVNQSGGPPAPGSAPNDLVWLNDGAGYFTDSEQRLGSSNGQAVALGDVDGDGDLDAFVGNADFGRADEVWWNDGEGNFTDSGQRLGGQDTRSVALDDLDRDGDLDAFVGNAVSGWIWTNDGLGRFTDSDQRFDWSSAYTIHLADVDGDGNTDVFAIRFNGDYRIWRNDGAGWFRRETP